METISVLSQDMEAQDGCSPRVDQRLNGPGNLKDSLWHGGEVGQEKTVVPQDAWAMVSVGLLHSCVVCKSVHWT